LLAETGRPTQRQSPPPAAVPWTNYGEFRLRLRAKWKSAALLALPKPNVSVSRPRAASPGHGARWVAGSTQRLLVVLLTVSLGKVTAGLSDSSSDQQLITTC